MAPAPRVAALVLAAGESRRFGGIKLLAAIDGQPLLARSLAVAEGVLPGHVHVVLGAHRDALAPFAGTARIIDNPRWRDGLSASIATGVAALDARYDHVLILLADQPAVTASELLALLDQHLGESPDAVTCARYGGILGIPAVFAKRWFPTLCALRGDRGARDLLRSPAVAVSVLDLPGAAFDIDVATDLQRHRATHQPPE